GPSPYDDRPLEADGLVVEGDDEVPAPPTPSSTFTFPPQPTRSAPTKTIPSKRLTMPHLIRTPRALRKLRQRSWRQCVRCRLVRRLFAPSREGVRKARGGAAWTSAAAAEISPARPRLPAPAASELDKEGATHVDAHFSGSVGGDLHERGLQRAS